MKKFKTENTLYIVFFLLLILIIIYKSMDNLSAIMGGLFRVLGVLKPFFIGFVMAYILNLPCRKIEALINKSKSEKIRKKSKGISIITVYVLGLLAILVSIRALVPAIYSNLLDLYNHVPSYLDRMIAIFKQWQEKLNIGIFSPDTDISFVNAVQGYLTTLDLTEFSKYAQGVINITSGVISFFIAVIVSIYMLIDSQHILDVLKSTVSVFISEEKADKVSNYLSKINSIFSKYIYCRVLDAVIIAAISTILLAVLGVKYSLVLGLMIGILNLIPYFGSIISTVIAMIITLVSGGWAKMIWTGVALLILQQIDGNFIGPKIMGNAFEIRPLLVIFAVTVGGGLFGMIGLLISVPIAVVIKMILTDYIEAKRIKNNEN